jgi:hypothetical protein
MYYCNESTINLLLTYLKGTVFNSVSCKNLSRYVSDARLACAKISEHLFPKIYPQKVKPQKLQQINEIIHVFKPEGQTCCKFVIVFFCPNFDIYTMYKRRDDGNR